MKKCKDCFVTSCSYRGTDDTECFYQKQKYIAEKTERWWQSFRAEAAKDILCAMIYHFGTSQLDVNESVIWADILIEKLKEKGGEMNAQEYKIKGWVARDFDGELTLCKVKPSRCENGCWVGAEEYFPLNRTLFPELTWKDEPIEVELTIKKT